MFYTLPFQFGEILQGHDAPTVELQDSIDQHLHLLITTRPGENRYDFEYGNKIWEMEFENAISVTRWEDAFQQALLVVVQIYEWRLTAVQVTVRSELVEKVWPLRSYTEVKKKVTVWVNAQFVETGEKYAFRTELYISPMSTD